MPKSMSFAKGSIVYFEGDKDESIYIIQQGIVILKSIELETGSVQVETLKTGEFFGVKSALAHMPRTETACVADDSMILQLSVSDFETIFSNKQAVTEKMLRVFSFSLRDLHKRTEEILKKDAAETPAGEGMFLIANAFYNDEEYRSCCDILKRIIEKHSSTVDMDQVSKLYKDAALKAEQQEHNQSLSSSAGSDNEVTSASLRQFALPVFDRFTKNYKKGDVIISEFEPGETFYLIKSGQVQIVKTMNGQNKNLDVLKPSEFFGEMAILDNSPRTATCVARTDCSCLEFSKENFKLLVMSNGLIVMNLLKLFCKRICDQTRRLKIILIKDISVRIADIFLMLVETDKSKQKALRDDIPQKLKFDVTFGDIAGWAGISQNVAKDELSKMQDRHKIEMYETYINVVNIHDMKRMVDSYYKKLSDLANSSGAKKN